MADLSTFERYYKLADMLIEKATKEQLAECARLLALNLAHHQARHGEIPLDETLALVEMTEPNEAQVKLLTDSMETLVGVLGNVVAGWARRSIKDSLLLNRKKIWLNIDGSVTNERESNAVRPLCEGEFSSR